MPINISTQATTAIGQEVVILIGILLDLFIICLGELFFGKKLAALIPKKRGRRGE